MKIYYHPVSTTSRPVMLFCLENKIDAEFAVVDLMTGEHKQPAFLGKNPTGLVPLLEDGNFRLSESSAILKYLADKAQSPTYPKDLQARAKVNEMMDWINTQLCRDLAYGLVYPQVFPTHQRRSDEAQQATLAWAKENTRNWFKVLDEKILGASNAYLCGNTLTIADYFASSFVGLGEILRVDYSQFPNVNRWFGRMKAMPSWAKVNEVFYGFAGSLKDKPLQAV